MERRPVPFVFTIPVVLGLVFLSGILGWGRAEHRRMAAPPPAPAPAPASAPAAAPAAPDAAAPAPKVGQARQVSAVAAKPEPFMWPVIAPISSTFGPRWGRFHAGIDIAANMGDSIKAARSGDVIWAGTLQDYGLAIILRHADGTKTLYGHCSVLKVKAGEKVEQGQVIGLVGSTGLSTGPHLHFEVRVNDQARDPLLYLPPNQYVHP